VLTLFNPQGYLMQGRTISAHHGYTIQFNQWRSHGPEFALPRNQYAPKRLGILPEHFKNKKSAGNGAHVIWIYKSRAKIVGGETFEDPASRGGVLRDAALSSRAALLCQAGALHHSRVA
jgi:hypothetical protein